MDRRSRRAIQAIRDAVGEQCGLGATTTHTWRCCTAVGARGRRNRFQSFPRQFGVLPLTLTSNEMASERQCSKTGRARAGERIEDKMIGMCGGAQTSLDQRQRFLSGMLPELLFIGRRRVKTPNI